MPSIFRSSRRRYEEYRRQLPRRRKEGSAETSPHGVGVHHSDTLESRKKHRSRSFWKLLGEFWGLLRVYHARLILALALLTFSTVLGLIPLYATKIVFDNVLGGHPLPLRLTQLSLPTDRRTLLWVVSLIMVVLAIFTEMVSLWSRWQSTRTTQLVRVAIRKKVFDHAVRLPLHRVYDLKSGGVASILREDGGAIADLIFSLLYNPWRALIQLIGSLFVLAFVDWRLLLGSLLLLPTVWLTHRLWINHIRPIFRDIRSTRQSIDAHATEAFGGMRVVRSFSRQRFESNTFTRNSNLMSRQEIFAWWWMRGIDQAWSIIVPIAMALLIYFGGRRVLENKMTVGDLMVFMAYLMALLGPIATLAASATGLQTSLAALDRVLDLLKEPLEMPPKPGSIAIEREQVEGRITLEHVSFTYPASQAGIGGRKSKSSDSKSEISNSEVLHDISLDVAPGEMIALVGPSGAGKTTLCNLIARFYDPTSGSIRLDGVDLRDITVDSYRRLFGIVEQDTFLFDGTIGQNIAYADRNAPQDHIERAARLANAHDFITKLPDGYDTLIGERGVKLSGGQRQRLTIARALLADPKILILDEATSNLDTESERLIQGSLQNLMHGRTSFVIAHRLSTIQHADRIIVLENGRIVEQGGHDELMEKDTRYRDMVLLQTSPPASPVTKGESSLPGYDQPLNV